MGANGGLINYLHKLKVAREQGLPAPAPGQHSEAVGHMQQPHSFGPPPAQNFTHPPVPAQAPISGSLPHPTTHPNIVGNSGNSAPLQSGAGQIKLGKLKKMMNLPQ